MKRPAGSGWRDPLGLALALVSLLILILSWHGAVPVGGLVVTHWHATPTAR